MKIGRLNNNSCLLCGYNSVEKLTFSTFPANEYRRALWVERCGLKKDADVSAARLCSKHFLQDDYKEGTARRQLKNNALPSQCLVIHTAEVKHGTSILSSDGNKASRIHKKCLICEKTVSGRSCSRIPKDEVARWEWLESFGIDPTDPRLHADARVCEDHIISQLTSTAHQRRRGCLQLNESDQPDDDRHESDQPDDDRHESDKPDDDQHEPHRPGHDGQEPECVEPMMVVECDLGSVTRGVADAGTQTDMDTSEYVGIDDFSIPRPPSSRMSSPRMTSPVRSNAEFSETPARSKHCRIFKVHPNDVRTPGIIRTTPRTQSILRMYRSRVSKQKKKLAALQQQVRIGKKKIKNLQEMVANLRSQNLLKGDECDQLMCVLRLTQRQLAQILCAKICMQKSCCCKHLGDICASVRN